MGTTCRYRESADSKANIFNALRPGRNGRYFAQDIFKSFEHRTDPKPLMNIKDNRNQTVMKGPQNIFLIIGYISFYDNGLHVETRQ